MKKLLALILSVACVLLMFSGCGGNAGGATSSDVIKIGVFEPLTGANAGGGALELEGMQLANKLYPEVLGRKVELVIADNKSDKAEAATAAARLIEKDKVVAILGSWGSGLSMAAGDLVKNNKIPAVGASCTNPLVTDGNDYYFRVCFLDPFQGTVMANYAYHTLGARKVAIIQEISNDYSVGLADFFVKAFTQLTGDENCVVAKANYQTNDQEFTGILQNIKDFAPDVVFAPGNFTESALIIKQAKELGMETPIIGGNTWETPEFIEVGGDEVEGTVFSTFFDSQQNLTTEGQKFVDAYKAEYKKENIAAVTALAYDAYILVLDAIQRAGSTDPEKIRDALAETKDFEGATGKITIDANGDAIKNQAVIKVVKDSLFTYLETVTIE